MTLWPKPFEAASARQVSSHRINAAGRAAWGAGFAACYLLSIALHAAPLLRCRIEQGGDSRVLDVAPVADPYTVAAIDINGRFRFKAVVIGDTTHVDYVKLYVYYVAKEQRRLIHQTTYLAPLAKAAAQAVDAHGQSFDADAQSASLTGINHVYSPSLERELQYACALLEGTP